MSNKYCIKCNRPLAVNYSKEICIDCIDRELFNDVKDFIRANHVSEYQVAEHFNIPLRKVRQWILEDKIQYVTNENIDTNKIEELRNKKNKGGK